MQEQKIRKFLIFVNEIEQNMQKRCQAALEFLITYGWAILVVLVAIGALSYFGVLNFDMLLPERCVLPAGITCLDFKMSTSSATVALKNNFGETITLDKITVARKDGISCSNSTPIFLKNNDKTTVIISNCNNGDSGKRFNGDISVDYTKEKLLSHSVKGSIQAKLTEGEPAQIPPPPPPPPTPCTLTSVSLSPNCGADCSQGETVSVNAIYSGDDCPSTAYLQVNADDSSNCLIRYSGGDMQGIYTTCSSSGNCGTWTVPAIANDCKGKTVTAKIGYLYEGGYPGTGTLKDDTLDTGDTVNGNVKFENPVLPGGCASFTCPSLISGVNNLAANPIQVWMSQYGNNMDCVKTCSCPAGTEMNDIAYLVDTEQGLGCLFVWCDYLEICGERYDWYQTGTKDCNAQSATFRFHSDQYVSYNEGYTQYRGAKITSINCGVAAPPQLPPGTTIKVAVEQKAGISDGEAGADNVVSQLNDRSFVSGLGAIEVSGANIDSASELNNYDVVVIGSSGVSNGEDYDVFDNALETWVSNGHGVVATGSIIMEVSSLFGEEGIVNILPVRTSGSTSGTGVDNLNQGHPVTSGVSTINTGYTIICPQTGYEKAGSTRIGDCRGKTGTPGVVVWNYGSGRVVYINLEYMQQVTAYNLRTGQPDKLLEQAVKWASKK